MKKIKGILLFGILTLLGIGSSFAINSQFFFVDYQTLDNKNVSFGLTSVSSWKGGKYFYSLTSGTPINPNPGSDSSSSNYTPKPYLYYDNGNILTFTQGGTFNLTTGTAISDLGIHNPATYVHIVGDDSCINTGILSAGTCSPSQVLVIDADRSYSDLGIVFDSQLNGVNYIKGVSAFTFPSTYSVTFSDYDWSSELSGNFFMFKTLYRQDDSYSSNRFFSTRLNNFEYVSDSSSFDVLLLAFTGSSQDDYDLLYTIYNCPSNSYYYSSCVYVRGGYVKNRSGFNTCSKPNNSSSVVCFDSILSGTNFLNYMFKPHHFLYQSNSYFTGYKGKLLNSYNSTTNILSLKLTYANTANTSSNNFITSYNLYELDLSDSAGVDILDGIIAPPNYSVYPDYGIFGGNSLYYHCNVDHTTWDSPYCYNPDGTLKSDDELKSCYFNTYIDMSDGGSEEFVEYYCIDDHGLIQNVAIELDGSGAVFVPCEDFSCQYTTNFGFIGNGYDEEFFDDFFNKTGYFFKCPWPYDKKLTIWPKLVTLLNGVDLLVPINCGIAGFSYGKNMLSFGSGGQFLDQPLLHFEGNNWDTLYLFFDVLLSIGIILFVGKIFYLFHK